MIIKDLLLLEVFIDLATTLSFSKTAQRFNTSQSFISKKVSQLESNLQTSLLIRTTRNVKLSESGQRILPLALRVLEESENLERVLSDKVDDKELKGRITISASETYMNSKLVPLLSSFASNYPNISIDIRLGNDFLDLTKNEIDFVFRIGNLPDSSFKSIKIEDNQLVFCTNPSFHKKLKGKMSIEQLKSLPIMYLPFHGERKVKIDGKSILLKRVLQPPAIIARSGETINQFAISSDRIGLRSVWDIQRYVEEGKLKILKTPVNVESNSSVYILYANRDYLPQRMKIFLNYLRKEMIGN